MRPLCASLSLLLLSCRPTSSPVHSTPTSTSAPTTSITSAQKEGNLRASSLKGLFEATLSNGLTVYLYELRELPLISLRLVAPAGSAHDTPKTSGLARLTNQMMLAGTQEKDSGALQEEAAQLGAKLLAETYIDDATLGINGLSRDLTTLLQRLSEITTKPNFTQAEFSRRQEHAAIKAQERLRDAIEIVNNTARAAVFGAHPYGLPPEGTPDTLKGLSLEDVKRFYQSQYTPAASALIVAGDFDAKTIFPEIKRLFEAWKSTSTPAPIKETSAKLEKRRVLIVNAQDESVEIRVAAPCLNAAHPDTPALDVVNDSLGGGFTSRLLDELRVNLGITYDVTSVIQTYKAGGWLSVETSTSLKNARVAVDAILRAMAEHKALGPTKEDLKGAKAFFSVDTARLFETPNSLAETLAQSFGSGAGPESLARYQERLDALDRAGAAKILEDHFPTGKNDVVIVITGPAEKLKKLLIGLGDVEVLAVGERPK